jgi:hypothetical protein
MSSSQVLVCGQGPYSDERFSYLFYRNWEKAAIYYYVCEYNLDDKTESEMALLRGWWGQLQETMPEKYRSGLHLLKSKGAFFGEDLYLHEGHLLHTLQEPCRYCHGQTLLPWGGETYCTTCNKTLEIMALKEEEDWGG